MLENTFLEKIHIDRRTFPKTEMHSRNAEAGKGAELDIVLGSDTFQYVSYETTLFRVLFDCLSVTGLYMFIYTSIWSRDVPWQFLNHSLFQRRELQHGICS